MLTKKQKNLLLFINKKLRSSGVSPSYEEMKQSLNLKSKSGIHRLISALEERGFIKRLAHKARALEVIKLPETASANDIYNSFSPSVIKGGLAEEIKEDIVRWGAKCDVTQLNILEIKNLYINFDNFNQLYYFASPKIKENRSGKFDHDLYINLLYLFHYYDFENLLNLQDYC